MSMEVIINFILALAIGAIIGLEREIIHQKENVRDLGGVRTFILISILGFILSYISFIILNSPQTFMVGFSAFLLLVIAAYVVIGFKTGRTSVTTEFVAILAFIISSILALNYSSNFRLIAIILSVIVASLLAMKENLHKFAKKVRMNEVFAAIKMALISIIILPLLPNQNYTLLDMPILKDFILQFPNAVPIVEQLNIFNPFSVWLIVVFISALSFIGYIAIRVLGVNRGIGLTSFLGGMVSSTAVTVSLSSKFKNKSFFKVVAFGVILASSVMLIRVLVEILAFNKSLFPLAFISLFSMALVGFTVSALIFKTNKKDGHNLKLNNPFDIVPALRFGLFFLFVLAASKILYILYGNTGIYIAALISGLADVDAITVSVSTLLHSGLITSKSAIISILLAIFSNTLVKIGIVFYFANKKSGFLIALCFAVMLLVGLAIAFVI